MKITESLVKNTSHTIVIVQPKRLNSCSNFLRFERLASLTPFHFNHLAENVLEMKTQQFIA